MLQLPVELLCDIFLLYFYSVPFDDIIDAAGLMGRLLTRIRRVCRRWNAITIATPGLWTDLRIHNTCRLPPNTLSTWLERSKTRSLHIEISLYWTIHQRELDPVPELFSVLRSSVPRWKSLTLEVQPKTAHLIRDNLPLSRAGLLESLHLQIPIGKIPETLFAHLGTIPNIKSLYLSPPDGNTCGALAISMGRVLGNISHLRLYRPGAKWEHTWAIFQLFRFSGTVLDLDCLITSDNPPSLPLITFLNLKILRLSASWRCASRLLASFYAPTLQVLDLDLYDSWNNFPRAELVSDYFSTPEHSVQVLRIWRLGGTDDLDRFFHVPAVKTIPFVEINLNIYDYASVQARTEDWSGLLGRAIMVKRGIRRDDFDPPGVVIGWNDFLHVPLSLADYFSSEHIRPFHKEWCHA